MRFRFLLSLLFIMAIPGRAAMDITRELVAPDHVAPGQPIRVAITFWTDSWFNPPPEWPDFKIENGTLLTTPLPNQLLSRQKDGISWSGVRLERQAIAWDQGTLRLPADEVTVISPSHAPVTIQLPMLEKEITWPNGVQQPDRFLPASNLTLHQEITLYHAGNDNTLRVGDVIERTVTVKASGILPNQIPQLVYAIPGEETQRLTPINTLLKTGRGDIEGAQREERLRYLPTQPGTITLPPIKLRWWNTTNQQWQLAELKGDTMKVATARAAGSEKQLQGTTDSKKWYTLLCISVLLLLVSLIWFLRHTLRRSIQYLYHKWQRFWNPVSLPDLIPVNKSKHDNF